MEEREDESTYHNADNRHPVDERNDWLTRTGQPKPDTDPPGVDLADADPATECGSSDSPSGPLSGSGFQESKGGNG